MTALTNPANRPLSTPPKAKPGGPIQVLIVDDSPFIRQEFQKLLAKDPDIVVQGTAADAYEARDRIVQHQPDVVTLDIEMPRMDGLTFLGKLMKFRPVPVVVVSSLTTRGGKAALEAIHAGALEVVSKPGPGYPAAIMANDLISAVKAAARAKRAGGARGAAVHASMSPTTELVKGPVRLPIPTGALRQLIAIGASTGGTQAIEGLLLALPRDAPPIAIVQHMPPVFTRSFAERLAAITSLDVREAVDGDALSPGTVLIAPGGRHMTVANTNGARTVIVRDGPRVNSHCPSVDVLFHSVAEMFGRGAVGVLLTGMGSDGAAGLLAMKRAGASTLAQSEEGCVVFGMPKVAIDMGAADEVVQLERMPARILAAAARR